MAALWRSMSLGFPAYTPPLLPQQQLHLLDFQFKGIKAVCDLLHLLSPLMEGWIPPRWRSA
eukprot:scaffold78018_cov13-Tisochrysis_lutea.AAC.1